MEDAASNAARRTAEAHDLASRFAHGARGAWRVDRSAVADRLHELIEAPVRVRQGRLNLCGPATLFMVWLLRDPVAVVRYAESLYEEGAATIGKLNVAASRPLRDIEYTGFPREHLIPPADWMMMAALRDSTNRVLRYDRARGVREGAAGMTLPGAMRTWLSATDLFTTVRDETNLVLRRGLPHVLAAAPAPGRDVMALVAMEMFRRSPTRWGRARDAVVALVPNHWVLLRAPVVKLRDGRLALQFWSWGAEHTLGLDAAAVRRCYFGTLTAEGPGQA